MSGFRWFLAACCIIFLGENANALSAKQVSGNMLLSGPIEAGDYDFVRRYLALNAPSTVYINSNGGAVSEALKIANLFRTKGMATHLPKRSVCASACVLLFAGGVIRTAAPTAKIGIHVGSGVLNDEAIEMFDELYYEHGKEGLAIAASIFEQTAARFTLEQTLFLLDAGVSLQLLEKTIEVHHLDILWLNHKEALEFNLINAN